MPHHSGAVPPVAGRMIAMMIAAIIGFCVFMSWRASSFFDGQQALVIPGARDVSAVYFQAPPDSRGLTLEEVMSLDAAGKGLPLPDSKDVNSNNDVPSEERWFRFRITNPSEKSAFMVLDPIFNAYDFMCLHLPESDGKWHLQYSGISVPRENRNDYRWGSMNFTVPPGRTQTMYLQVRDYHCLPTKFYLWNDPNAILDKSRVGEAISFGFFAAWLVILLNALFRYAMLRQRDEWHYCLYTLFSGMMMLLQKGSVTALVIWPPWAIAELSAGFLTALAMRHFCLFTQRFLDIRVNGSWTDRSIGFFIRAWTWFPLSLPLCFIPSVSPFYFFAIVTSVAATFMAALAISLSSRNIRKTQARLFALSFMPFFITLMFLVHGSYGANRDDAEEWLIIHLGKDMSLVLLSLAPAYKHRLILQRNAEIQANYTKDLEHEVAAQTRELRELGENLKTAIRQRDQLITIIGHDLRGPAQTLNTLISRLIRALPPEADPDDIAGRLNRASSSQVELINNLLVWGGLHSSHWRAIPTTLHLREEAAIAWRSVEEHARMKRIPLVNGIPENLRVRADGQLIQTVLRNLFSNAVKFTHDGGTVTVSARLVTRNVMLSVKDEGIGIPREKIPTLLGGMGQGRFGTQGEKGSGIGLQVCRDLVAAAGGTLSIESEPGDGTLATILLPSAQEKKRPLVLQG